jgi:TPR repeat protein
MLEEKPSLHALEIVVRRQLASSYDGTEIEAILAEAENENPAAEFIIAGALESGGQRKEAMKWYRHAAQLGYLPALERLRRDSPSAA